MTSPRRLRRSLTRVLLMVFAMLLVIPGTAQGQVSGTPGPTNTITDVPGIAVGHHTRLGDGYRTGTTVVRATASSGATTGYSQLGGAPGTKETDLLKPGGLVTQAHAVVLSGGSAYGLDTATGVMRWLEERNTGFPVGGGVVPIVPAAILFDLGRGGNFQARPNAEFGYLAADATNTGPAEQGRVGAGMGASRGLGTASVVLPNGFIVGAIVGLNPGGNPINPSTCLPYGAFLEIGNEFNLARPSRQDCPQAYDNPTSPEDCKQAGWYIMGFTSQSECATWAAANAASSASFSEALTEGEEEPPPFNTTIAVVATNAPLNQTQAERMAMISNSGLSRSVKPIHNLGDGDSVFGMATASPGNLSNNQLNAIYNGAADALGRAVVHAVLNSGSPGTNYCASFPSVCANRTGGTASSSSNTGGDAYGGVTTVSWSIPAGGSGGLELSSGLQSLATHETTLLSSGVLMLLSLGIGLALYALGRRRGRLAARQQVRQQPLEA